MTSESALATWLRGGAGCGVLVGSWPALEAAASDLAEQGLAVHRLTAELLARLPDPAAVAALEVDEQAAPTELAQRRAKLHQHLATAFSQWLEAVTAARQPVVVRELELAVAERLDLTRLTTAPAPVLLLVPGRRDGRLVRAYAPTDGPGVPLPPALTAPERVFEVAA